MLQGINFKLAKLTTVVMLAITINTHQTFAQAPDCDECDDLIDDIPAYLECVEENCSDSIPVDNEAWILMIGGIGMGAYAFYRYNHRTLKPAGTTEE